jgi:methyltransferase (TIGR00027 family)
MAGETSAAQTAYGPMVLVAVEQFTPAPQRIITDELAIRFMPALGRWMIGTCRWGWLRKQFIKLSEAQAPGIYGGMLCRKRYADDRAREALAAGIPQVVILGAGLDTKAYRLVAPQDVAAFEVDQPESIAYKENRLRAIYGRIPDDVTLVSINFETDDLATALTARGFDFASPALFVWEAVTQYLTEDAVRKTLGVLAQAATGSQFIFTFVLRDYIEGVNMYGCEKMYQNFVAKHVWKFGLAPDGVAPLLNEYSWTEREQVGHAEFIARYIAPTGRNLAVYEIERFVLAEKQ